MFQAFSVLFLCKCGIGSPEVSPGFCSSLVVPPVTTSFSPMAKCSNETSNKASTQVAFSSLTACCPSTWGRFIKSVLFPLAVSIPWDVCVEVGNNVISLAILPRLGCQGGIPPCYLQFALIIRNALVWKNSRSIIKIKHNTSWGRNWQCDFLFPRICLKQ